MNKSLYNATMWGPKKTKLAILVPSRDMVYSQFAYCLSQLTKTLTEMDIDHYVFMDNSTILLNQRERLITNAIDIDADYVLWIDSDMVFPSTVALRLLEHNKDIVACNYMKRTKPLKTVAYTNIKDWGSWVPLEPRKELIKVEGVGMGCMLMKTSVFKSISRPYFEFTYDGETKDWHGEDFMLLTKLRLAGYDVFIDTVLSMEIKHLGLYAY